MNARELDCDTVLDLLAIEAIEGPGEQADALDGHCATCGACGEARDEYRLVASMLVYGLPHTPAGPELRERLRLRVALIPANKASRWRRWPVVAGSGIAAAVLVGGAFAIWNAGRDGEEYGGTPPGPTVAQSQWYALAAAEAGPGASGGITIAPDTRQATLAMSGLPSLPEGKVYEFWFLLRDGTRLPVLRFSPRTDGSWGRTIPLPGEAANLGGVWVTLEPAEATNQAPGPNVLVARFPQQP
jgi:hypothetical protein